VLPDGRVLFDDISFRVGEGAKAALIGANGSGKSTLIRLLTGDTAPAGGAVTCSGGLGVMPQFIGHARDGETVQDLLVSLSGTRLRTAARRLERAEERAIENADDATQMAYAEALAEYADAGGHDAEVRW